MNKISHKEAIPHFYAEQHVRIKPFTSRWFVQPQVISVTLGITAVFVTLTAVLVLLSTTVVSEDCGTPPTVVDGSYTYTDTTVGSNATYTCRTGWDMIGDSTSHCGTTGWTGTRTCKIGDCGEPSNITDGYRTYPRTTYAGVVTYYCNIGYIFHGNETAVCQDDDTWNGTRYCEIVDCLDPANITDGNVTYNLTTYTEGANYSCRTGYDLFGDAYAECSPEGNWTGTRNCTIGNCGTPPSVIRGSPNYTETTYQAIVTYYCDVGYNLTGDTTAKCLDDDSWSGNRTCDIVDCGVPANISNAYVTYVNTTYESVATYTCQIGYNMSGPPDAHCEPSGLWNASRDCIIVDCGIPVTLANANLVFSLTTYDETATYTCDVGYTMTGSATIKCLPTALWETEPVCIINDCGAAPSINNGTHTSTGTTYGETASYTCNTGYTLTGSATINCLATPAWETAPTCQINDCSTPPTVSDSTHSSTGTTYLETATYTCNVGYTMSGTATITCQANSVWETAPSCVINDCSTPPTVNDSTHSSTGTTYLETATYTCDVGYTMSGTATITCQANSVWETAPSCVINDCGSPPTVTNSTFTSNGTTYGSAATYTCDAGYQLSGAATINCLATSSWESAPTCTIKDCGALASPTDGSVSYTATTYLQTATYTCNVGHTLTGTASVTCLASGAWSASPPTCNIVDCGVPPTVSDGNSIQTGTTYLQTATYTCDTGYNLVGTATITCQATSSWEAPPSCDIVDCGALTSPTDGTVVYSAAVDSTTYSKTATYSCNTGYTLAGATSVTCQADGSWSSSTPTCTIVDCGTRPTITNGVISSNSGGTTYGETVTYNCDVGYTIGGATTIACQDTGSWEATPTCTIVDCGTRPTITNGVISSNSGGTTYGGTVTYNCDVGYTLGGASTIACQDTGSWEATPTCTIVDCGAPTTVADSSYVPDPATTTFGSSVMYTCTDPTLTMTPTDTSTCQADGAWSDSATLVCA